MIILERVAGREVRIAAGAAVLEATLAVPDGARALAVLAGDEPEARRGQALRETAHLLHEAGIATLAADLLAPDEADDEPPFPRRPDLPALARRLQHVTDWALRDPELGRMRLGYVGIGRAAAAALSAAARRPHSVRAVVSVGGWPALAAADLPHVKAAVLLLAGGDREDVERSRAAAAKLRAETRFGVVPGVGPRPEGPLARELAGAAAAEWLEAHLVHGVHAPAPPFGWTAP